MTQIFAFNLNLLTEFCSTNPTQRSIMKKILILMGAALITTGAFAQKSKIQDASNYMSEKDYKNAMAAINEAVENSSTSDNPKAWYTRGKIYFTVAVDSVEGPKYPNAAEEATRSFMKVVELKPNYPADEINNQLMAVAVLSFNAGIQAYEQQKYDEAYKQFNRFYEIYNVNNGARFGKDERFGGMALDARRNASLAAINAGKYKEALDILNDMRGPGKTPDSTVYISLIDIYTNQKNQAELANIITEARQKFPNNQSFRNAELNMFITSGNTEGLIQKLEAAAAADPNNADLYFNLGNAYNGIAFAKDAQGNDLPRPANYDEIVGKAETAYQNAIKLNKEKPEYAYNLGVLYYNQAIEFNKKMGDVLGNKSTLAPAEEKVYNGYKAQRDALFTKSVPYMEQAMVSLKGQGSAITADDKRLLYNLMNALAEMYQRTGQKDKATQIKADIDAFK